MSRDDFAYMDLTEQAELARDKQVKPEELVEAAINRIERLNPELNAVVTPMFELAAEAAKGELPDGPFKGAPYLVKDLIAECRGVRLTEGSHFLGEYVSEHDTELVRRLKKAGLVILGKTNTPEFGILPTTESQRLGPARNPWDTTKTTGGSSGGTAAAVASGMTAAGHGNDGGGSIRIPASCCGLFGFKPTRARNPLGPDFGDIYLGLVCEHAITRSVRDSAALLDATSGPAAGDPYHAPAKQRPYLEEVGADPGRLKIGFTCRGVTEAQVHPDCVETVKDAAGLCEELGHVVEEVSLEVDPEVAISSFMALWSAGCAWEMDAWSRRLGKEPKPECFEPLTWAHASAGRSHSAPALLTAIQELQRITRKLAHDLWDYDVVLTPVLAEPPVPLGTFDSPPDNPLLGLMRAAAFVPFTPICNITGQPAMSVPLLWNDEGLPVGAHFMGRFGDEATLFRLAGQLEKARPWSGRRPRVCA